MMELHKKFDELILIDEKVNGKPNINGKSDYGMKMPPISFLKKKPEAVLGIIKSTLRNNASNLHDRWTNQMSKMHQKWKVDFYPFIKMSVEAGPSGRVTKFRAFPLYPPGTWHKSCLCPFCRCVKFKLGMPVQKVYSIKTGWPCLPSSIFKDKEYGDRCREACLWNESRTVESGIRRAPLEHLGPDEVNIKFNFAHLGRMKKKARRKRVRHVSKHRKNHRRSWESATKC